MISRSRLRSPRISIFSEIALVIILYVCCVVIRTGFTPKQLYWTGDSAATRLIAEHILNYGEFPVVGPEVSNLPFSIRYPPYHYYLIAFFSLFSRSTPVVAGITIGFESLTLLFMYYIARTYFTKATAITTAFLLTFAPLWIAYNTGILGTFLTVPIFYGGLASWVRGEKRRQVHFKFAGYFLMILSSTLSFSVLPFIFAVYAYDQIRTRSTIYAVYITLFIFFSAAFLFYPTYRLLSFPLSIHQTEIPVSTVLAGYPRSLWNVIVQTWKWYFSQDSLIFAQVAGLLFCVFVCLGLIFSRRKKTFATVLFFLSITFLCSGLLPKDIQAHILHNMTLVYPFACLVFAEGILTFLRSGKTAVIIFGILGLTGYVYCNVHLYSRLVDPTQESAYRGTQKISEYIKNLHAVLGYSPVPYVMWHYSDATFEWNSPELWYWQETISGKKITTVSEIPENITVVDNNQAVYLVCEGYQLGQEDACPEQFIKSHPNLRLSRKFMYSPISDYFYQLFYLVPASDEIRYP